MRIFNKKQVWENSRKMKTTAKNRRYFEDWSWEKIFVTNKSSDIAPYDQNNMNIIRNKYILRSKQHTSYQVTYVNKKSNHDVTRDGSYVLLE